MAVVTGASQGIGEATALAMADLGADVAICDREADGLAATADAVEQRGRRVLTEVMDVRDDDAVEAFMGRVDAELGPLDVLAVSWKSLDGSGGLSARYPSPVHVGVNEPRS